MGSAPSAVLLNVDDDEIGRYARTRVLQRAGFEVRDAADGRSALARMLERPDLVLLDVGLPDMSGFDVCRRIKADRAMSATPVLQVSATFTKAVDRARALNGGADGYLIEPVEPEVLVATVNAMLRARKAESELARSARVWQATFDAIGDGIALVSPDGTVVRGNRALPAVLDTSRPPVGRPWWEVVGLDGPVDTGRPIEVGVGGRWVEVAFHTASDEEGAAGHRVMVVRDLTERRQVLAVQAQAREVAEQASLMKDQFLAMLSHELRAPLNTIIGWTHLLRTGGDRENVERAVEVIERNANLQARLISDILDTSRIVAGKMELVREPVDLAEVTGLAVAAARPEMEARGLELQVDVDPAAGTVFGDADRLQQVVSNLLSNAIKFSSPGGRVELWLRRAGGDLELGVRDEGVGIAPDFLPLVFEPFRQADSSSRRRHGGVGLGLAIVRHLVERHGGTIQAHSEGEGKGARFIVRLPRAGADPAQPAGLDLSSSPAPPPEILRHARVLLVEDSRDLLEASRLALEMAGASVRTAVSCDEALRAVEEWRPEVVVCDIGMPGEDGYSFIEKLRLLPAERGGTLPAIAWTGYVKEQDRLRSLGAGFQVHLAKPATVAALTWAVARVLGRA